MTAVERARALVTAALNGHSQRTSDDFGAALAGSTCADLAETLGAAVAIAAQLVQAISEDLHMAPLDAWALLLQTQRQLKEGGA